jgi:hypothetical protein
MKELNKLKEIIKDDSIAITYQSMRQYRNMLLKVINEMQSKQVMNKEE